MLWQYINTAYIKTECQVWVQQQAWHGSMQRKHWQHVQREEVANFMGKGEPDAGMQLLIPCCLGVLESKTAEGQWMEVILVRIQI